MKRIHRTLSLTLVLVLLASLTVLPAAAVPDGKGLINFRINGVAGVFGQPVGDRELGSFIPITVYLPAGTDVTDLAPAVSLHPGYTLYVLGGEYAGDGCDFTDPVWFEASEDGGDGRVNYKVTVVLQGPQTVSAPGRGKVRATWEGYGSIAPVDPEGGYNFHTLGSSPKYTVTPDQGATLVDLLVDGESVGTPDSYTFTDIDGAHRIHAIFSGSPSPEKTNPTTGGSWLAQLFFDLLH